jgi:methionyl-tRNA synthetase
VLNFSRRYVLDGLRPRPITRDLDWGIPVPLPGWEGKKLYIWFENVIGYLSAAIEWARNSGEPEAWRQWWTNPEARSYYFLGQDNIPFHAVTWPAQLLGAAALYQREPGERLQLPYDVPANRQYTLQNREFSKSKGWAVWLNDALETHHADAVRYAVAATLPENSDSDFSWAEFVRRNNGELVATWGNLVHRVLSFSHRHWEKVPEPGVLTAADQQLIAATAAAFDDVGELIAAVKLRAALQEALRLARQVNGYLSEAPWYSAIEDEPARAAATVYTAIQAISGLNVLLAPFLPFGAEQVRRYLGQPPLFGRQEIVTIAEERQCHEALVYDGTTAAGEWRLPHVPAGQPLPRPEPLYVKLKPPS